jgi:hypothetical protein
MKTIALFSTNDASLLFVVCVLEIRDITSTIPMNPAIELKYTFL